jgi:hypothetical protein
MINPDNLDTNSSSTSDTPTATGGLPVISNIKFTPGGKGQVATMTSPTGVLMDENSSKNILANMQKLLEEKPFENFQNDLKEMYAWSKYDKEPMFRQLAEEKQQKEAQRYNIMQSMEALKSSQGTLRNQAASLVSPQTGTAGTAAGTIAQAQGPINAATQAEIDRLIYKEGNVAAAQALRKRAFDEYNAASARKQFSADMDTPVEFINPITKQPDKMTRRDWAQYNQSRPEIVALINKANPDLAKTMAEPTQGKTTAADWAVDNGFQVISGTRTPDESKALVHHYDENGVPRTAQGRPIDLKTSPHFTGDGFDVKPGSVPVGSELEAKAFANGYKRGTGKEENHFYRTKTAAAGETPSLQEYESGVKKGEASQRSFLDTTVKQLADNTKTREDIVNYSDQVLEAIKTGKYGPGTGIDQTLSKYLQTVGIEPTATEKQKFITNLTIEQARSLMAYAGARQAMGAQFTQKEGESWLANFPGINDPKEYIKNMYQLQKARALVDDDLYDTLIANPGHEQEAYLKWKKSGIKNKIMQENVDAFKNGPKTAKAAEASKAKPVISNDAAVKWLEANPNHPDAPAVRKKLGI